MTQQKKAPLKTAMANKTNKTHTTVAKKLKPNRPVMQAMNAKSSKKAHKIKPTKAVVKKNAVKPAPKVTAKAAITKPAEKLLHKVIQAVKTVKGLKTPPAPASKAKILKTEQKALDKPVATKPAPAKSKKALAAEAALLAAGNMCRENSCENQATTQGYCRLDYIKNWKKIKRKEMILKEGKLNQYIEELVSKYPDKYIDVIRQDLSTEVNFNKVIHDLELDESIDDLDYDGDSIDNLIGSVKKEEGFDDDEF